MATDNKEKKNVTGLDTALDRKEAEYDLVTALLEAAAYKTDEDNITEVTIARNGKFLFVVHIHPISDKDVKFAQKKAGIYKPNPTNKKLGMIKVDQDNAKFASWMIYLATTEEDQEKIWGNKQVMGKYGIMENWESLDILLTKGEKDALLDQVFDISGMNDDDDDDNEDGNEKMDEETFQPTSD